MCPLIALARVSQQVVARTPAQQRRNAMTAVGFEPTPFRTGALSQRLRPLGQTVLFVCSVLRKPHAKQARRNRFEHAAEQARQDTLPEWSKGVDSSSTSASCVGSNPTAVKTFFQKRAAAVGVCVCGLVCAH